ncbi:MAG: AMP-binding protein [Deltaproteobacteria bacterium]|nr:AMP-binding protein [Deltaproteobacteria bacterium]
MRHLSELLVERARAEGDRVAILAPDGESVSFAELHRRVSRRAGALAALGLPPGARIVLLQPMGIALYEVLLALFHGGYTAVLVDPSVGLRRVGGALAAVGVDGLIGTGKAHALRLLLPALRGGRLYASTSWTPLPARRWSSLSGPRVDPVAPPGPALITFTSGTTGVPAPFPRDHSFLLAQHQVLAGHMGLGPGDVDLPTLPVFLLNSLAAGATCVLPDGDLRDVSALDPARLVRQIRAHRVTTTSGSPAYFERLVRHLEGEGAQLAGLDKVFVGGARVSAALLRRMCAAFPAARVELVYGSTEAEPIATLSAREHLDALSAGERDGRGALVGRQVPGLALRIARPDGSPLDERGPGAVGEVLVAGDHVNTAVTPGREDKLREGARVWHRTGDAGWRDDSGLVWLVGRVGQDVAGRWPFQVEPLAEAVAGVRRAALVEHLGQPLLAWEGDADDQEVRAAVGLVTRRLPAIPVDPRHRAKVDRRALRALL